MTRDLTSEEMEVCNLLGMAYMKFQQLPILHSRDEPEFIQAIHVCQNIILARPALESMGFVELVKDEIGWRAKEGDSIATPDDLT